MKRESRLAVWCKVYDVLLYAYPKEFRERFGAEMRQVFRDRYAGNSFIALMRDWFSSVAKERMESMSVAWNSRLWRAARGAATAIVSLLILVSASAPFLRAYVITSSSMEKTIIIGDHLLVEKLGKGSQIQRDEVVVIRYPLNPKMTFVKRVIGIPGDHIRLVGKQVIRNGHPLIEPYAEHIAGDVDAFRDNFPGTPNVHLVQPGLDMLEHHVSDGEVVVPEGSLFLLGDNRDNSLDSRYWGFLPREDVVGRPLFIYWSYDSASHRTRWGRTLHALPSTLPQEATH